VVDRKKADILLDSLLLPGLALLRLHFNRPLFLGHP